MASRMLEFVGKRDSAKRAPRRLSARPPRIVDCAFALSGGAGYASGHLLAQPEWA
jgi:hypothetical protein